MPRDPVKIAVRKGAWTDEEDKLLRKCIERYGEGRWHQVPLTAGLNRCRKSCRLRWLNYLKPDIKRGEFSVDEVDLIIRLHKLLGNRWSLIAGRIPGRTANDVKNYWNSNLRKKEVSCQEEYIKEKPKTITKTNILRPRPRTFSKNACCFSGKGTPFVNVEGLCKPSSMALPPSDNNGSDNWWKSILNDNEISVPSNTNRLGSGSKFKEAMEDLFAEENTIGEPKTGDIFFEKDQSFWNDDISFDVDLWDVIHSEQEQYIYD